MCDCWFCNTRERERERQDSRQADIQCYGGGQRDKQENQIQEDTGRGREEPLLPSRNFLPAVFPYVRLVPEDKRPVASRCSMSLKDFFRQCLVLMYLLPFP